MLGKNIFCIEGDWESDLRKKTSILSGLELLHNTCDISFIYKTCGTQPEVLYRLNEYVRYTKSKYRTYDILYMATHGERGGIYFDEVIDVLDFFTENFKVNAFEDRIIHFGSCATMNITEDKLAELKDFTGAKIISGFTKDVSFLESTLFEVLYFNELQDRKNIKPLETFLKKNYASLIAKLGFRMVY